MSSAYFVFALIIVADRKTVSTPAAGRFRVPTVTAFSYMTKDDLASAAYRARVAFLPLK